MIWFCGGHGACLTLTPDQLEDQETFLANNTIAFLNNALPEADGNPNDVVSIPKFQFVDQNGEWYTANYLPVDDGDPATNDFYTNSVPIVSQGSGGTLGDRPRARRFGTAVVGRFPRVARPGYGGEQRDQRPDYRRRGWDDR